MLIFRMTDFSENNLSLSKIMHKPKNSHVFPFPGIWKYINLFKLRQKSKIKLLGGYNNKYVIIKNTNF